MVDRITQNMKTRKKRSKVKFRLKLLLKGAVKTTHVQIFAQKVLVDEVIVLILLFSVFSLNNMEELLIVERFAFQNLPDMVKLELNSNPQLSYIHPQAFRCLTFCLFKVN